MEIFLKVMEFLTALTQNLFLYTANINPPMPGTGSDNGTKKGLYHFDTAPNSYVLSELLTLRCSF